MKNFIKIALFLILFIGFSAYTFGETIFNLTAGYYQAFEDYPEEDYGRNLEGFNFIIGLNHYPDSKALGWYFRTSFGSLIGGSEWLENQTQNADLWNSSDIQISAGPSIMLRLGSAINIPLTLGPVFTFYSEESSYSYNWLDSSRDFYRAYNLGLLAGAAITINPGRWLSITAFGLNVSWDFLHWESGQTDNRLRNINHGRSELVGFHGVKLNFHFGAGMRFYNNGRRDNNANTNTNTYDD